MYVSTQREGIKVIANPDCSLMFDGKMNLFEIDCEKLDTSRVTNMWGMFWGIGRDEYGEHTENVTLKGLAGWNVSNVTNMNSMFNSVGVYSTGISIGDLSGWDVSNVTDMGSMFFGCGKTRNSGTFDISGLDGWNVYKVNTISSMFAEVSNLKNQLNLYNWTFKEVWDLNDARFEDCLEMITPPKDWVAPEWLSNT